MSHTANNAVADTVTTDAALSPDVEQGKLLALLSYVIGIVAIVVLVQRKNAYALYHAKQSLTLCVGVIAASIALSILGIVLAMVKLGFLSMFLSLGFFAAVLGLVIVGALNAWNGRQRPLPFLGQYSERLFGKFSVK